MEQHSDRMTPNWEDEERGDREWWSRVSGGGAGGYKVRGVGWSKSLENFKSQEGNF